MNGKVNNTLLAGDKLKPEMQLRQPRFTFSAYRPFTKEKERIEKFKETGDSRYIYQNELHKTCFQHNMAYGDFKNLPRRTASDKKLCNKAFNSAKNPKFGGYQRGLASMVYKFFDKNSCSGAVTHAQSETSAMWNMQDKFAIENKFISNQELAEELHKLISRKLKKTKSIPTF